MQRNEEGDKKLLLIAALVIVIALAAYGGSTVISNASNASTTINNTTIQSTTIQSTTQITSDITSLFSTTIQSTTIQSTTVSSITSITSQFFTTTNLLKENSTQCTTNQYAFNETNEGLFNCKPIAQDYRLGLVAYYPLESLLDISGYGNTLISNTGKFVKTQFNNGLNFSGSTYANSNTNLIQSITTNQSMTISFWFNNTASGFNSWPLSHGNATKYNWAFVFDNSVFNDIQFYIYSSVGSLSCTIDWPHGLSINVWHFVVAEYNSISNKCLISVDNGNLVSASQSIINLPTYATYQTYLGERNDGATPCKCSLDEIRNYDFVFSQTEIGNIYQYYQNILNGV